MKTYNKTFLPSEIIYKNKTYKIDRHATEEFRQNRFMSKGHILVKVLDRNLRGRENFHGKPYEPTQWIFTKQSDFINVTNVSEQEFRELHRKKFESSTAYKRAYNKAMKQIKTFGY